MHGPSYPLGLKVLTTRMNSVQRTKTKAKRTKTKGKRTKTKEIVILYCWLRVNFIVLIENEIRSNISTNIKITYFNL